MHPSFLLVRFSAIGDCVMAAYVATAIRNKFPNAKIWWAVEERCAAIVDDVRLVSEKVAFPRDRWKQNKLRLANWREQLSLYRRMRQEKFDYGIDLQGHTKTALAIAMARPKRKIAVAATDAFVRRITPLIDPPDSHVHQIERGMAALRTFGEFETPELPLMPDVSFLARRFRHDFGSPRSLVAIAASAGKPDKAYPIERWNRIASALLRDGHKVLFVGGPEDPHPAVPDVIDRVGELQLEETMAALAASDLVLAGDTGAGHIAGAYGKPVISVFGPTDPDRFHPVAHPSLVLRRGTSTENVSEEEILDSARGILKACRAS